MESLELMMFSNSYKNKKVLVTGHTGFKGSWLVAWLQALEAKVTGIALTPNTNPSHFDILKLDLESYFIDIRNYSEILKVVKKIQPEIVFHLAAQPLVRDSYAIPLETFDTNIMGTANVLNACREIKELRAIVVVTSDKCYENKEWSRGYCENDPMGGYDPYSASKGCAELVTASFRSSYFNLSEFNHKHQVLIASARAGNVIGGGDWSKDRLIPDIMRAVASGKKVYIRNPQSVRPWQHVLECLSGYLCLGEKLLQGDKKFAEAWNFAPSGNGMISVGEVVKQMQSYWSKVKYEIVAASDQLHEAKLLNLDASKANSLLRWKGIWDLEKALEVTTNWYRGFYDGGSILTRDDIQSYIADARSLVIDWVR